MTDERKEAWDEVNRRVDEEAVEFAEAQLEPRGSEALRDTLNKILQTGHCNDTCSHELSPEHKCDCWKSKVRAALAAATAERTPTVETVGSSSTVSSGYAELASTLADRQPASAKLDAPQLTYTLDQLNLLIESVRSHGWQAAIEAAAKHVMLPSASAFAFCCSGCEWRIQGDEDDVEMAMKSFVDHIRSLRPSPAPHGGADGDQWPNDHYTEIVLPAPQEPECEWCKKNWPFTDASKTRHKSMITPMLDYPCTAAQPQKEGPVEEKQ